MSSVSTSYFEIYKVDTLLDLRNRLRRYFRLHFPPGLEASSVCVISFIRMGRVIADTRQYIHE